MVQEYPLSSRMMLCHMLNNDATLSQSFRTKNFCKQNHGPGEEPEPAPAKTADADMEGCLIFSF